MYFRMWSEIGCLPWVPLWFLVAQGSWLWMPVRYGNTGYDLYRNLQNYWWRTQSKVVRDNTATRNHEPRLFLEYTKSRESIQDSSTMLTEGMARETQNLYPPLCPEKCLPPFSSWKEPYPRLEKNKNPIQNSIRQWFTIIWRKKSHFWRIDTEIL